jgi:hypothetical protein
LGVCNTCYGRKESSLKHTAPNIGIKKQPKGLNITRFNIEQDSRLCVAALFGCIGQIYGSRMALQYSNSVGLKTVQTPPLMVFYWLRKQPKIRILGKKYSISAFTAMHELKNLLPKLIVFMEGS